MDDSLNKRGYSEKIPGHIREVGDYDLTGPLEGVKSYWEGRREVNGEILSFNKLLDKQGIDRDEVGRETVLGVRNNPPKVELLDDAQEIYKNPTREF